MMIELAILACQILSGVIVTCTLSVLLFAWCDDSPRPDRCPTCGR